jgi:hypothetical protein
MDNKYNESLYTKETVDGNVRIPYSFPLAGPHESDETNSEAIKQWSALVKKLN